MTETVEVQTPIPMTARVKVYTMAHEVELILFGKSFTSHLDRLDRVKADAQTVADEWNVHFANEWEKIQQTSEAIMQQFSYALRAEGVSDEIIDKAVASVVEYVKG